MFDKILPLNFFFFMILYKPQDRGRQPIGIKIMMPTERPNNFDHLLQV